MDNVNIIAVRARYVTLNKEEQLLQAGQQENCRIAPGPI